MFSIRRIVKNCKLQFSFPNVKVPIRQRTARSNVNIAAVQKSVAEGRNLSIPRRSQQFSLSLTTTLIILP